MHLLQAQAGIVSDGSDAVDLGQTPGDIVFLSAADTQLAALAAARADLGDAYPRLRLANLLQLRHNLSVDLYRDAVIGRAKLVIVHLLGGAGYWPYGMEQVAEACREGGIALALLPGDDQPDPDLHTRSTLPAAICHRLWQYLVHGGPANARNLLAYAADLIGTPLDWAEPVPLMRAGPYWPGAAPQSVADLRPHWSAGAPVAALVFYRALVQAGNLAAVDALIAALRARGVNPLPVYVSSLKEPVAADILRGLLAEAGAGLVLNATGFAVSSPGAIRQPTPFDERDCPVLQVVFAGSTEATWREGMRGLSATDIAMNVALPEVDGRILSRAVSFKAPARFDALTECPILTYAPVPDRVAFVADLAANWLRLRGKPAAERRIAMVLANYPGRDGRIGNGVGLDTPAGTMVLLRAMQAAGYPVEGLPADGAALIARLQAGPTNDGPRRPAAEILPRPDYEYFFAALPASLRRAVLDRWGPPERDPFYRPGAIDCGAFAIPAFRCGGVAVALQPARAPGLDPTATYHSADLVPPHGYLAFYAWLREGFRADAVVHMGKHGNLEWLPGKALALSAECFPEAALGPLPHVYPFIVNDPGEGTQAKRRAQAVIVDHLTPPLTRAESYGPLADLERLVDEYYEASSVDPRRLPVLRDDILDLTRRIGLDRDCGIAADDDEASALTKLDNHLCELKELQIRDGLHVFGQAPDGAQLAGLLVALARLPRGPAPGDASLIRALASDFGFEGFDPLDCALGDAWTGPRPSALGDTTGWRSQGDTVERLETLALALVTGERAPDPAWTRTLPVLDRVESVLRPAVLGCGAREIEGALAALDGRFVAPGPSGAPTRGRPDVLPTGRNFYSVDTRTVPTPAAWTLGWASAGRLLERHRQEHGGWPQRLALSVWGTANMRTGGDDLAQALALMGVRPAWDAASRRVTGFEIMPISVLDRPRVDVTLRISGFFRDAFPAQIDLFDSAVRAVAALDEPAAMNPLAARVAEDRAMLTAAGISDEDAARRAGYRIFGSPPGAYGAGLQSMIDEGGWQEPADLARAYLAWGGHAYGAGGEGRPEQALFRARLTGLDGILHNQDNREHDLLDSAEYAQFEGGMAAAAWHLSGQRPVLYHNDHSRPESPRIRTLDEEIARIVRARVVNPKWIAGVMRHGYKGAAEMAATVDYMVAFAATARAVGDHHFDAVYDAYLADADVRGFLADSNPAALAGIAARLLEAQDRGLWRPRLNTTHAALEALAAGRRETAA